MQFSPVVIKPGEGFFRESEDRTMEQMNSEVAFSIKKKQPEKATITKKFNFNTMVPQVELFSFVFWEN